MGSPKIHNKYIGKYFSYGDDRKQPPFGPTPNLAEQHTFSTHCNSNGRHVARSRLAPGLGRDVTSLTSRSYLDQLALLRHIEIEHKCCTLLFKLRKNKLVLE